MRTRIWVPAVLFSLAAGAIGWGVLSEARESRLQALLSSIEAAEEQTPYAGTRKMGGAETVTLRIWSRGGPKGEKKVEFVGVSGGSAGAREPRRARGPKVPFFGNVPVFLRPGHDQWKRRIKDLELAAKNYRIVTAGQETVAGRAAEIVDVQPRHPGRPGYRIWADAANRFPLRFEVHANGERVFATQFEEIQYHPAFPEGTFSESSRPQWIRVEREAGTFESVAAAAASPVWLPHWTPPGFQLRRSEVIKVKAEVSDEVREALKRFLPFPVPKLDTPVVQFTYTDGLAAIAVVQCPADSDLWQLVKKFIPPSAQPAGGGKIVARKFTERGGSAWLLELEGTVVLAAGNAAPGEMETMIRTFERR